MVKSGISWKIFGLIMNIFSLLIGTGLNLIQAPFVSYNSRSENALENSYEEAYFPFNLLRNTPVCSTVTFRMGENHLKLISIPRGFCVNCCPANLNRDVRFVLYNKNRGEEGVVIAPTNEPGAARKAGVDPNLPTVIYVHGFSESSPGESGRTIRDAYLSREDLFNVILVDWSELCPFPWYGTAVRNVKVAGRALADFIQTFGVTGEIAVDKLHVIGFSLGGHIASLAGKNLRNNIRIPRITALDPAFPEFSMKDTSRRLTETDAEYVDVIHTDTGIFGFPLSIGHADFYPNGGRALQPGCQPSYLVQIRLIDQVLACSHVRAWKLYAESVRTPKAFPATRCRGWRGPNKQCNFTVDAYMGYANNKLSNGDFFLRTGYKPPYSLKTSS